MSRVNHLLGQMLNKRGRCNFHYPECLQETLIWEHDVLIDFILAVKAIGQSSMQAKLVKKWSGRRQIET